MLDTRHAITLSDNGSTAQFNLFEGIDTQVEIQSISLQLLQFQASHSIYNITDANNTIEFYTTFNNGVNKTFLLTIPNGHYSLDYLRLYINDQLSATHKFKSTSSVPDTFIKMDKESTCEFTGLITFQLPSVITTNEMIPRPAKTYSGFYILTDRYPGLPKTLGFYSSNTIPYFEIDDRIGFGVQVGYTFSGNEDEFIQYRFKTEKTELFSVTQDGFLVGGKFLDLSYPRSVYLVMDGINTNNRCSLPGNTYGTILDKIPLGNSTFGDNIYYEPYNAFPQLIPNFHMNTIKIRTLDENGQTIDWNNGYWSIKLGLTWSIDLGSSGQEDTTGGRHFRPLLHSTEHDPLRTQQEHKRRR